MNVIWMSWYEIHIKWIFAWHMKVITEQFKQQIQLIRRILQDIGKKVICKLRITFRSNRTSWRKFRITSVKYKHLIKCSYFSCLHVIYSKECRMVISISRYLQVQRHLISINHLLESIWQLCLMTSSTVRICLQQDATLVDIS